MTLRKMMFALVGCLCIASTQISVAAPASARESVDVSVESQAEEGVINSIDTARNRMVISDMEYGFSGATLSVHGGGRTSGLSALRPNQKIRFLSEMRKPGSRKGLARTVTEIWIEQARGKP